MAHNPVRRRARSSQTSPLASSEVTSLVAPAALRFAEVAIGTLRTPARNIRRSTKRLATALKASLLQFGLVRPILADQEGTIVAGVAIWGAAKELGFKVVPVVYVEHLTAEQIRLYRIADNKLGELGSYDEEALRLEFIELGELSLDLDLNLDLEITGFTTKEIDDLALRPAAGAKEGPGDGAESEGLEPPPDIPVTQAGDIWLIGDHKIICGNSLEEATYLALLGEERAQMIVADGPYNVPIKGHVSSRKDAREFAFACGDMSSEEFIDFERGVFRHLVRFSIDGSIHYNFMSWHSAYELMAAGRAEYTELKNMLVWQKTNASRGFYRSQYELCFVYKNGTAPHICTFGIEEGARWRSNVITMAGCNSFGRNRDEDLADHPTVKPMSLIADLLRDCSKRHGIILDPFGGSGTTLLAAEWTGRRARLIEINPAYVDVTIRRAQERFGLEPVLAATGQTFEDVAAERLGGDSAITDDEIVDADASHGEDADG